MMPFLINYVSIIYPFNACHMCAISGTLINVKLFYVLPFIGYFILISTSVILNHEDAFHSAPCCPNV